MYDYLNLATRSPQVCINKGERANKFEVSECSKSFNTFSDSSQNKHPPRKDLQHCRCVFLPSFVFPVRSSVHQRRQEAEGHKKTSQEGEPSEKLLLLILLSRTEKMVLMTSYISDGTINMALCGEQNLLSHVRNGN